MRPRFTAGLSLATSPPHLSAMPFPTMPDAAADRAHEHARRHPERETLELAMAGAAKVLGPEHSATKALARASLTMDKADLWKARLAARRCARTSARPLLRWGKGEAAGSAPAGLSLVCAIA